MKKLLVLLSLASALALCAFGQDVKLPTYIAAGAAFNQMGSPRVNLFVSAIAPVSSPAGVYESTTADLTPVVKVDPATGKRIYTFASMIRQGVHKTIYANAKTMLLVGGDLGAAFSQASPSGTNVSLAGSAALTFIYQVSPHWALMAPLRGVYSPTIGGWNLIPQAGIVWKP